MSFSNIIRRYFSNLFISIVPRDGAYAVYGKVIKRAKVIATFEKDFEVNRESNHLDEAIEEYLLSLQEKYQFAYVSLFLDSLGQGAIKGTEAKDFEKFSVDSKNVKTASFGTWSAYASFIDINWANNVYKNIGLDFIYSPFVVLYYLLSQQRPQKKTVLYLLNQQNSIALGIFQHGVLCFGVFSKIEDDTNMDELNAVSDWEEEEEAVDVIDDVKAPEAPKEEEDEFLALDDLASLDNDEESPKESFLDEVDAESSNAALEHEDEEDDIDIMGIELYGRDMKIYKFLSRALREYYDNPIYESDFVSKMVLFDGYEMSQEIIQSIENELFLSVDVHKINIGETICDMSVKEANNAL
ncbi:hypothetical protein [Sulfurospirillum sp. 1612]|uniref:hypothetical protein n=1 Tax=Sulfurospirillum sp. 1612 TaxID=3094835 RepID=UPI002F95D50E